VAIKVSSGPAIDHQGALGSILLNLQHARRSFSFDEIHRLNSTSRSRSTPALEDFRFDAVLGKGVGASAATLPLPHFHVRRRHHEARLAERPAARPGSAPSTDSISIPSPSWSRS